MVAADVEVGAVAAGTGALTGEDVTDELELLIELLSLKGLVVEFELWGICSKKHCH